MSDWDVKYAKELEEGRDLLHWNGIDESWSTEELTSQFTIDSFLAPFCFGTRKSDGVKVSLQFGDFPARLYYSCQER